MQKIALLVERVLDSVNFIVGIFMAAAIALIFVLLTGQVVLRYLILAPVVWVEEGATYLLAVLTLLGMSLLLRQNAHLQVELFRESNGRVLRDTLRIVALLATAGVAYYLMRGGWDYAIAGRGRVSPSGTFFVFWPRLALPIGAGLLMVQALFMAFRVALPAPIVADEESL